MKQLLKQAASRCGFQRRLDVHVVRLTRQSGVPSTGRDSMNFDIKTEQLSDDAYVISLAGEVDLYTAPEFKQQLLEVIGQGGKQVIVDFTSTTFIDSTTLGVLVGGVKRLRTNDGQLSLVCSDREHHQDLRDHGPRPRLPDLRRRATKPSSSSTAATQPSS